jgi:hypothetical protein
MPPFLTWGCRVSLAASFDSLQAGCRDLASDTKSPPFSIEKHFVLPPTLCTAQAFPSFPSSVSFLSHLVQAFVVRLHSLLIHLLTATPGLVSRATRTALSLAMRRRTTFPSGLCPQGNDARRLASIWQWAMHLFHANARFSFTLQPLSASAFRRLSSETPCQSAKAFSFQSLNHEVTT